MSNLDLLKELDKADNPNYSYSKTNGEITPIGNADGSISRDEVRALLHNSESLRDNADFIDFLRKQGYVEKGESIINSAVLAGSPLDKSNKGLVEVYRALAGEAAFSQEKSSHANPIEDRIDMLVYQLDQKGVSERELVAFHESLGRIISAQDSDFSPTQRLLLVDQLLAHFLKPHSNDQLHNTCNVTVLQEFGFFSAPHKIAELIADVVTTGHYSTNDGRFHFSLDEDPRLKEALTSFTEAQLSWSGSGVSMPGKIFQTVAVNALLNRRSSDDSHDFFAPSGDADANLFTRRGWFGSKLLGSHSESDFGGASLREIAALSSSIFGRSPSIVTVTESEDFSSNSDITLVKSADELAQALFDRARSDGWLREPVILWVDAFNPPFSDGGSQGVGSHVVSVTQINAGSVDELRDEPGRVLVSNQWGNRSDQFVSLRDLFQALL